VGGSMLVNDPDAAYYRGNPSEPPYQGQLATQDARWICGAGDADGCSTGPVPSYTTGQTYINFTYASNYGPCVTLFAPAKNITSARTTAASDYRDRLGAPAESPTPLASGTSFSAPIAAA